MVRSSNPPASESLGDEDRLLRVLSKRRCRVALRVLRRERSLPLEELAEIVTREIREDRDGEPRPAAVDRTVTALFHCDVPRLADLGVVDASSAGREVSIVREAAVDGWPEFLEQYDRVSA